MIGGADLLLGCVIALVRLMLTVSSRSLSWGILESQECAEGDCCLAGGEGYEVESERVSDVCWLSVRRMCCCNLVDTTACM